MTQRVTVNGLGGPLSVLVTGRADGPTIVLSNSLGAGLGMWAPQRAALERHYRVIGYDTRGHGQSATPEGIYSFADLTGDVIAVMDHFKVAQADYLGLSLGGMTGLGLGLAYPDRFRRIVCACARADAPPPFANSWDDRIAAITAGGMQAIWPGTLERWLTTDFAAQNPQVVASLAQDFVATTVPGYIGCARALQGLDYLPHLGGMTVPTMFIAGAQDMGAPASVMEAMATATPGSAYLVLSDCAHIANLNQPDAFTTTLTEFFLEM